MKKLGILILSVFFGLGCVNKIVDNAVDQCQDVVDEATMECYDQIDATRIEIENYCSAEIEAAVDGVLEDIEMRIHDWLVANNCVETAPDQWNCVLSPICGG